MKKVLLTISAFIGMFNLWLGTGTLLMYLTPYDYTGIDFTTAINNAHIHIWLGFLFRYISLSDISKNMKLLTILRDVCMFTIFNTLYVAIDYILVFNQPTGSLVKLIIFISSFAAYIKLDSIYDKNDETKRLFYITSVAMPIFLFLQVLANLPLTNEVAYSNSTYETALQYDLDVEEYKERQVDFYASYKNGTFPKSQISKTGWKVIYEYELENGYITTDELPQWAIDAYDINLNVVKTKEPNLGFYKLIFYFILSLVFLYFEIKRYKWVVN